MESLRKKYVKLSRAAWENIALYLGFVAVYCAYLATAPVQLEGFESWVNGYLPLLDKPWPKLWTEMMRIDHNDSNCSVNSPPWFVTIRMSLNVFGDTPIAYRLPDVLLTAFVPVLTASIVRRFFNPGWGLWVGILAGAHHHTLWFARTGGYIGPTMTLFLLMMYLCFIIAFENKRWPWIPLAVTLILAPFFYAVIRYYFVIAFMVIPYQLLFSREFRRIQILPIIGILLFLGVVASPLMQGGPVNTFVALMAGRGEQFLLTERVLKEGPESEAIKPEHRLSGLVREIIPTRFRDLVIFYDNGRRFFHPYHQDRRDTWRTFKWWVLGFLGVGAVTCIVFAFKSQRYAIPVIWSIWAWLPLLVTTGIYPGRLFLGIPADMFMITAGLHATLSLPCKFLSLKLQWIADLLVWLLILAFSLYSIVSYFQLYI